MMINDVDFPIVKIDYKMDESAGIDAFLSKIDQLLAKQQAFVFLSDVMPEEGQSIEDRRKIAIWIKQHQIEVEKWIKGHVHIVDSPEHLLEMENFSVIFKKFWGYPLIIVETLKNAHIEASKLLD